MTALLAPTRLRRMVESPAAPIALLVVFAGLIVLTINRFSIWIDESATLLIVAPNGYLEVARRTAVDAHPPLWYWVLKPWLSVFGTNIVAARAQQALFMLAAFGLWYHFVRTRFSRSLAVLALALMVTNPMLLHYAVEGRMYAFSLLLVSVTCALITGQWRWRWFAYWPCAVAMLYTHYFLSFVIAAQFLYLMLSRRKLGVSLLWLAGYGASIIVAFGPWIPYAFVQTRLVVTGYFWIGPVLPTAFLVYVWHTFLHRNELDFLGAMIFPGLTYFAVWPASLIRAGRAQGGPYALLWCLTAVPWVFLFVLSVWLKPVFHPRYVIFGLPALITLLSAGALGFTRRWRVFAITVLIVGQLAGIKMLRSRGFHEIAGHWAMKKIAQEVSEPIDGELPWVASNWIFTFFDARAALDERQHVVILSSSEPRFVTPEMVYYGHPDWYVSSLSDIHARHVWVIDNAEAPAIDVPPGWECLVTHRRGYARTRLFKTDVP